MSIDNPFRSQTADNLADGRSIDNSEPDAEKGTPQARARREPEPTSYHTDPRAGKQKRFGEQSVAERGSRESSPDGLDLGIPSADAQSRLGSDLPPARFDR